MVGHFFGDWILQNDWMALNKRRSHLVCAWHSLIVTTCICLCAGWWNVYVFAYLLLTHFLIDRWDFVRWSMRWRGCKAFVEPPMAPWSIILTDQIYHLLVIWSIGRLL